MMENVITFRRRYAIVVKVRLFAQYTSTAVDLLLVLLFQPSPSYVLIYISMFFQQRAYSSRNLARSVGSIDEIDRVNKQANGLLDKHLGEFGLLDDVKVECYEGIHRH